ncbi:dTMP kinase [uncultured Arthrobacter sp.]|uniref:dTMP kinase n=1 Tax=uncultured Arthrobacter sp. TaxID=114050 RepID=UPI00321769B5
MLIVLTGIDGSGKTTAAQATVDAARQAGRSALFLRNYAGRRRMSLLSARLGRQLPARAADSIETAVRTSNVLNSHRRARKFDGLVVMDRHLHCQLALRGMHGLARGRFLPWLIRKLPQPDLIIYLDIDPQEAHARILERGTDSELLEDLVSLRDAYQALPEFPGFTRITAGGSPASVITRVQAAISDAAGERKECCPAGTGPAGPSSSGAGPKT